ncbi:DUF5994 family protein [Streptomyces sp. NPDC007162]|uniref:DUF5994 family protein n=1 Tax=Streptomyces sp. NPDC007162 TaxID=3156917 RepID=UPI0033BFD90D
MTATISRPASPEGGLAPVPRLTLAPTGSATALLDGAWWPRSRDRVSSHLKGSREAAQPRREADGAVPAVAFHRITAAGHRDRALEYAAGAGASCWGGADNCQDPGAPQWRSYAVAGYPHSCLRTGTLVLVGRSLRMSPGFDVVRSSPEGGRCR